MTGMMLTNPKLVYYIFLAAASLIGVALGFIAARYGLRRRIDKMIDVHTHNALSERDAQLTAYLEDIAQLETEIQGYQARFKMLVVFLSKAIEALGGVR